MTKRITLILSEEVVEAIKKHHEDIFSTYKAESGIDPPEFNDEWLIANMIGVLEIGFRNIQEVDIDKISIEVQKDIGVGEL